MCVTCPHAVNIVFSMYLRVTPGILHDNMAKSAYDIAPDATYVQAAHTAIRQQLQELMDNLPGTRQGDDVEALHDMRVASRRLRAALSVFAAAFPPKPFLALEKQVARVTDSLGVVRDADVLIEFVTQARDAAPESERVGIDAYLDHLKTAARTGPGGAGQGAGQARKKPVPERLPCPAR